jgi:hypothetical protein
MNMRIELILWIEDKWYDDNINYCMYRDNNETDILFWRNIELVEKLLENEYKELSDTYTA